MKKIVLLGFLLVFFSTAIVWGLITTVGHTNQTNSYYGDGQFVFASSKIIWVPDNFTSIQEAVNNASDGDIIFIGAGTYYETVVINKAISLIGENKYNTIIDGQVQGTVIRVKQANVSISGFTIKNSTIYTASGIEVYKANYVNITDNIITNNRGPGVFFYESYYNTVSDNIIMNNQDNGIFIYDPSSYGGWNLVEANSVINNSGNGILITESHRNVIEANFITNNINGLGFIFGVNNTIKNNIFAYNQEGVWNSRGNSFFHNHFINNTHQVHMKYAVSNRWDDGYPSGGNYWSDYKGTDLYNGPYQNETGSDGIGDTSYTIDEENEDRYPLMNPHTSLDMQIIYNELYELLTNHWDLQSKYDNLVASYNSLQAELKDLESKNNSLKNELNGTRNIVYALLTTTIFFMTTTIYFTKRKPKAKQN